MWVAIFEFDYFIVLVKLMGYYIYNVTTTIGPSSKRVSSKSVFS